MPLTEATQLIIGLIILMMAIIGTIFIFVLNRKRKAKVLVVLKDWRNPSRKPQKYYAINSPGSIGFRLYTSLLAMKPTKVTPRFDMAAYTFDQRIYAYQGVTGHPGDDTIVPIRFPDVSQITAKETAKDWNVAVANTLDFYEKAKKYTIGSEVKVNENKGIIYDVGYEGITIDFNMTDANNKPYIQRETLSDWSKINQIRILSRGKGKSAQMSDLFNYKWLMNNFGIMSVQDVNVALGANKEAVAQFNTTIDIKATAKQTWLNRNAILMMVAGMFLVICIDAVILWSGTVSAVNNYLTHAGQSATGLTGLANTIVGAIQPH